MRARRWKGDRRRGADGADDILLHALGAIGDARLANETAT